MLLRYSIENFRSFRGGTSLLMAAGTQRTLDKNLIRKEGERILPSAVVYGANASGKSNIILSIEMMKEIVLHGGIGMHTPILDRLELYTFAHECSKDPMIFDMDFTTKDSRRYQYTIAVKVGDRCSADRKIVAETLKNIAGKKVIPLFHRDSGSICLNRSPKGIRLMESTEKTLAIIENQMNQNLDPTQLCLTSGFKAIVNNQIVNQILDFFNKLIITSDFKPENKNIVFGEEKRPVGEVLAEWNHTIETFKQNTDFGPQRIFYETQENQDIKLCSSYQIDNRLVTVPSAWMESHGTLRLIDFVIPFKRLFSEGGVFVLDEFDTAFHPQVVMDILTLFHDQRINLAGAQMIFTTFNPAYLDHNFLRRDQIWFVEKDKTTHESRLYSLADFGSEKVRNDHNYLKHYMSGSYGAVPDRNYFIVPEDAVSEAI